MHIIDGKKLANTILENTREGISKLDFKPVFCDVLVGNDSASIQYVKMKRCMAEKIGISFHEANFSSSINTDDLIKEIRVLNKIKNMCGIIVQLPLPENLDKQRVFDAIDPEFDVDCLGSIGSEKFYSACLRRQGDIILGFPTALSCMALLDSINLDLKGKKIVILGWGMLVGKPVAALLSFRNLSPVIIRSKTENKEELIREADIIISGMGKGKYIKGDMIKKGAVLIDAGTSESGGGIVGDIDLESVKNVASYVSPVPGGVGPVTVAILLNNVLKVAQNYNKN